MIVIKTEVIKTEGRGEGVCISLIGTGPDNSCGDIYFGDNSCGVISCGDISCGHNSCGDISCGRIFWCLRYFGISDTKILGTIRTQYQNIVPHITNKSSLRSLTVKHI